jgi:prepilin-type N-terminal cleavage/methylation domain-containing protein
MMMRSRKSSGFTLVELVIVVGLIGAISALAIPNFLRYQARSRRSEAWVNVASIVRAQKSYFAERNSYHDSAAPWPDYTARPSGVLDTTKQIWDGASKAAFNELGWLPEGPTMYSYETNTTLNCDGCELCFTASAYGDADGDGFPSAVMYVQPHDEGGVQKTCKAKLFGFGTPTRIHSGAPVYNEVEVNRQTDEF